MKDGDDNARRQLARPMLNPYEYDVRRAHLSKLWLMTLQYVFWTASVGCMIILIWNPLNWLQIVATAVLLLFAGGACKQGRG